MRDFRLARLLRQVFAERTVPLQHLLTALDTREAELPPGMGRATLLDNHDMHRFLWLAGGHTARLHLAATCQMTLPGAPIVYYGTEVGLSEASDAAIENAHARAPMLWGEDQDRSLLTHFRQLIALRHAHPALRRGQRRTMPVELRDNAADAARHQVGAYLREMGDDRVLVVLNNSEQTVRVRVPLDAPAGRRPLAAAWRDALADLDAGIVPVTPDGLELELPALSAAVLVG